MNAELFKFEDSKPNNGATCRTCEHRQPWQCGGSVIQYCGIRGSNRTFNKLLKIKVTNPACAYYQELKK